ncbi:hypothetical protein [Rhizobium sp. 9140]|uniref:hypothetical protein n=1 Tax=Rhizobium sp. 9140 TaxID=1761900 RepID=UPI0007974621|nr:hypothetical protein [Rhizobium sp. 9140]CZT34628.1 hypothetical protein GA0004734_00016450 [Rhizobium sp. 9140]
MSNMSSEAMPETQAGSGDTAAFFSDKGIPSLPIEYLKTLSRRDLLDVAEYVTAAMERVLDVDNERAELAYKRGENTLYTVSECNHLIPVESPHDAMIADRLYDVCDVHDEEPQEWAAEIHSVDFLLGAHDASGRALDLVNLDPLQIGDPVEIALRALMVAKLREGPMTWTDLHVYLLQASEADEEKVTLHMILYDAHHAGLVEASTVAPEGLFIDWTTVVRLGVWYNAEQSVEQSSAAE